MDKAEIFTHGTNAYIMFKFPARRESLFELRFPEHWGSPSTSARYGQQIRVHQRANTIEWQQPDPHHAQATWQPGADADPWDRDWSYTIGFRARRDYLDICMDLNYTGREPWDGLSMLACLRQRMADPFIDNDGDRTYLFTNDGCVSIAEMVAGDWPDHRMVGAACGPDPQHLTQPLMTTVSRDGAYACAIAFRGGDSCSSNFGSIHCIHSNPRLLGLQPGETRRLRGRVYCLPITRVTDVLDRWLADTAGE